MGKKATLLPTQFVKTSSLLTLSPNPNGSRPTIWFPGLNGLRFFAAALVVVMHIHNNMGISGLPQLHPWPILFKGLYAVAFFFVLSGFLITYLLMREMEHTKTISIKGFYLRRVFRIWPLYFLVITIGAIFYWVLAPELNLSFDDNYSHSLALFLYTMFLANLMNSLYHVGGILHITWSIAVEEQFYLFWAPMVKRNYRHLSAIIGIVTFTSLIINLLNTVNVFHLSKGMQAFVATLQFHYMGVGAGFAWLLYKRRSWLLHLPVFRFKGCQLLCLVLLLAFFLFYKKNVIGEIVSPLPLSLLFGWLIINVSSNGHSILHLENKLLDYLGKISYGIYMYHMPVVYAVAFFFKWAKALDTKSWIFFPAYYILVFILTILIASISYKWIEKPFSKLSKFI